MPAPRALLIFAISLVIVFAVSFGIGYVYQYDPERDVVELVIDRSADVESADGLTSGIVRDLTPTSLSVETGAGTIEIPLADITLEALIPLDDPSIVAPGTPANLGGERTSTERVISGLVFLDGEVQP